MSVNEFMERFVCAMERIADGIEAIGNMDLSAIDDIDAAVKAEATLSNVVQTIQEVALEDEAKKSTPRKRKNKEVKDAVEAMPAPAVVPEAVVEEAEPEEEEAEWDVGAVEEAEEAYIPSIAELQQRCMKAAVATNRAKVQEVIATVCKNPAGVKIMEMTGEQRASVWASLGELL